MEQKVDIEKLINEIESRPTIWDMRRDEYSDRVKRNKCWEDITNIFAEENATNEEKKKLGKLLHKKWKNIRDRYAREIQESKGKSGSGSRKKVPYMYAQQLSFLRDTLFPRNTTNSLDRAKWSKEPDEQETIEESEPSTSIPSARRTQIGKKRYLTVEDKLIAALEINQQKRIQLENMVEDDNRHFVLSLQPALSSLPRHLNTKCRIEILQIISKYETLGQFRPSPQQQFQSSHPYDIIQQSHYHFSNHRQQEKNRGFSESQIRPEPINSPVESDTYVSSFSGEEDSQFNIFS